MGIYFATYEAMTRGSGPAPAWLVLAAGGTAGAASWVVTYPVDVLKSRIQADGCGGTPRKYSGMVDCLRQSVRSDGWSCLTRGLGLVVVRAFPTNAACFFTVTLVLRWDQERRRRHQQQQLAPADLQPGSFQLQLRAAWHSWQIAEAFGWRRSVARSTACSFLKLEDPRGRAAACREGQNSSAGEPARGKWSRLQYESVHRLFLHAADFTESSWLSSAEFLSPPEGDGRRHTLWKRETRQLSEYENVGMESIGDHRCSTVDSRGECQGGIASSVCEETPASIKKLDPESEGVQIMGSPANGFVRKPDAVHHISRGTANRIVPATQAGLLQGYILPSTGLWLDRDNGSCLEGEMLSATEIEKSFPYNEICISDTRL